MFTIKKCLKEDQYKIQMRRLLFYMGQCDFCTKYAKGAKSKFGRNTSWGADK